MRNRPEIQNISYLKALVESRHKLPSNAYSLLIYGINTARTPQGNAYWVKRYYWLAAQVIPTSNYDGLCEPMSEEDWGYLNRLANPPVDDFLTSEENKEFIV